jgi:hypothetical protein
MGKLNVGTDSGNRTSEITLEESTEDAIRLQVTDAVSVAPVPGALVTLDDGTKSLWGATDSGGTMEIPGHFFRFPLLLKLEKEAYRPVRWALHALDPGKQLNLPIHPELPLRIVFKTQDGSPIPRVRASLHDFAEGWSGGLLKSASDELGEVRFSGFATGPSSHVRLIALGEGYVPYSATLPLAELTRAHWEITVTMQRGCGLQGVLIGPRPLEGIPFTLEFLFKDETGGSPHVDRSEDRVHSFHRCLGETFFLEGIRSGPASLRIRKEGEVFLVRDVVVQADEFLEVVIEAPPEVEVTVLDSKGHPIEGAEIVLSREDPGFSRVKTRGESGPGGGFSYLCFSPAVLEGAVRFRDYKEKSFRIPISGETPCLAHKILLEK